MEWSPFLSEAKDVSASPSVPDPFDAVNQIAQVQVHAGAKSGVIFQNEGDDRYGQFELVLLGKIGVQDLLNLLADRGQLRATGFGLIVQSGQQLWGVAHEIGELRGGDGATAVVVYDHVDLREVLSAHALEFGKQHKAELLVLDG